MATIGIVVAAVSAALALGLLVFRLLWRVAEPNEALVISGFHHAGTDPAHEGLGFKIVTGKGVAVAPGFQQVRRLTLDLREAELRIDCVTHQGIPVGIKGVVIFKVGDDYASIANAARRFLDQQDLMEARVHNVFAGHLRAIVGNLTMEELIRDREKLTSLTRQASGTEMEKLGLIVDSLQIQELDDPTGYITNLGRPHAAAVASQARIAQAAADRDATDQEQQAEALKAESRRNAHIKQAGYQAEVDEAASRAKQAGPLAEARARQEVLVQETKVAELAAQREEQRLQVTVRRPADAKAYESVALAKGQRDARIASAQAERLEVEQRAGAQATRVRLEAEAAADQVRLCAAAEAERLSSIGDAQASATRAVGTATADAERAQGLAEADAIKARAEALAENQEAVIGQQLAEHWPEIVEAAAKPFGEIDQLIVLNGAEGLSQALAQAMAQGAAGLQLARNLLAGPGPTAPAGNGTAPATSRP